MSTHMERMLMCWLTHITSSPCSRLVSYCVRSFSTLCLSSSPSNTASKPTRSHRLVKNGFSDPNKVQKGQDRQKKDVKGDRQGKALKEGCHERRWAQMGVSSREEINTNRNLARATTKSKSGTQTVSNGCVGRRVKN